MSPFPRRPPSRRASTCAAFFCLPVLAALAQEDASRLYDRVLASVNGEIITLSETREAAWGLTGGRSVTTERDRRELADALDALINQRLIAQAARKMNIEPDTDAVDRAVTRVMEQMRERFGGEENLRVFLDNNGLTVNTFQSILRQRESRRDVTRRALRTRVRLTDAEVEAFETRESAAGRATTFYQIDQILIAPPPGAPEGAIADAHRLAVALAARIQQGEDFEALAFEYSTDRASAKRGGDMGWISREDLRRELRNIVEPMEPGDVSPPIHTDAGVQILRLEGKRTPRDILFARRIDRARSEWLSELRERAQIVFYPFEPPEDEEADTSSSLATADGVPKERQ